MVVWSSEQMMIRRSKVRRKWRMKNYFETKLFQEIFDESSCVRTSFILVEDNAWPFCWPKEVTFGSKLTIYKRSLSFHKSSISVDSQTATFYVLVKDPVLITCTSKWNRRCWGSNVSHDQRTLSSETIRRNSFSNHWNPSNPFHLV